MYGGNLKKNPNLYNTGDLGNLGSRKGKLKSNLDYQFGKDTGFNSRPMMNAKMTGMPKKFDDTEINEAKEHLKLLKAKLGNTQLSSQKQQPSAQQPMFTNNNYRKPFNPNFDNDYGVKSDYLMYNHNSKPNYTNPNPGTRKHNIVNTISNKTNLRNNRVVEDVIDDRPAFNKNKIE